MPDLGVFSATIWQNERPIGRWQDRRPDVGGPQAAHRLLVRRSPRFGQHGRVILDVLRRRWPSPVVWTPGLNRFAEAQVLSGAADALVAVSLAGSLFFSLSPEASQRAGAHLPDHQHGAVRGAGAAGRSGHRPPPPRAPRHRRVPVRPARRLRRRVGRLALLDLGLYFFALALLFAAKASGVVAPGARARPRRRPVPARRRQLPPGPPQRDRRRRRRRWPGPGCWPLGSPAAAAALACALVHRRRHRHPPAARPRPAPEDVPAERRLRGAAPPTIVASSWAFTVVRASVGFFVFGLAFALRRESEPAWMYGAAVAAVRRRHVRRQRRSRPLLRRRYGEDRLIAGALVVLAIVAAFGALGPSRPLVLLVAVVLGGAASVARQGFDSLVQTRAPWRRTVAPSPASRPGSRSAGSPEPSPPRPSASRFASASASSPSA